MAINPAFRVCTPTSIAYTGTGSSAVIRSNGSIAFDTCATLSLNGVFTSSYDNYMINIRWSQSTSAAYLQCRLRASGSDSTATTDYNHQELFASSTTVAAARVTNDGFWKLGQSGIAQRNGLIANLYGPYLSQPTAFRSITVDSTANASIDDYAGTHELSTSYDGLTVYVSATNFSGLVTVIGFYQ